GLLGGGEEGLFQRQPGSHQGRELPRQQREVGGGDAAGQAEAALALRLLLRDLADRDRGGRWWANPPPAARSAAGVRSRWPAPRCAWPDRARAPGAVPARRSGSM